tara:strand:- start:902 stop:2884 length:1983 start_codon:yes stop_codon:yes gene_type:complete
MDKILSINLATSTAPTIKEVQGVEYIEYGNDDGWRNLYPQFLIDLYYNSSTHAAIINGTAEMIAGEDLVVDEDDINLEAYVKLKKFLRHANSNESLHQIIKKVAFDFKLQGAYAMHIVWNIERTAIVEIFHVPVERVRAGRPNEFGKVDTYYISSDWSDIRTHIPYPITAFNVNDRTSGSQLLYTGSYSPNMDVYHTPDYLAANNWALVDQRVAEFHLNNINNSFSGSYLFSFANGIPTDEERRQIEQSLTDKFIGASNAGKFILAFSDDRSRAPEVTPLNTADLDKQYLALQTLLVQNILTGHRVTSKTLLGIDSASGFSSNADELLNAANFYQNSVIRPFQLNILDTLQTIFSVNQMDLPVSFIQLKPITIQFDSATIRDVMTQDEIRESIGLPPLNADEVAVKESLSKVGVIDGKPVFDTIEEAEAHATTLGCEGYHEHEYEGKVSYMACKDHSEATSLSSWIAEFGEDMSEDWEVVDKEVVHGEHTDFDFESELNNIANKKIELAEAVSATPNKRSSQDGVNDSYNEYYKVRYVYARDTSLNNKSGTSRDFCKDMMSANKYYTKSDLKDVNSKTVNPGFGHDGSSYDIFLFKGGPQCLHFFERVIFRFSLRNAKKPLDDGQIISEAKARSEGFTAEKNDSKVAIAPRNMRNNGYYN